MHTVVEKLYITTASTDRVLAKTIYLSILQREAHLFVKHIHNGGNRRQCTPFKLMKVL